MGGETSDVWRTPSPSAPVNNYNVDLEKQLDLSARHIENDSREPAALSTAFTPGSTSSSEYLQPESPPNPQPEIGTAYIANGTGGPLQQTTTSQSRVVPRRKRRGLLGQLAVIHEVEDPKTYTRPLKWCITASVAFAGAAAPLCSAIFFPALAGVAKDLHTSHAITNFTIAVYMLAMGVFPLWWSTISETYGRRSVYIISFLLFIVFNISCALSPNIGALIAFRILSGGAAASVQSVGAGTIADVWEPRERGQAMGLFYLGPLAGPALGPLIGGGIALKWGWRGTMWFMAIFGVFAWVFLLFGLPETHRKPKVMPVPEKVSRTEKELEASAEDPQQPALEKTMSRMSAKISVKTKRTAALMSSLFVEPLKGLHYIKYAPVFVTVIFASAAFGALLFVNVSLQATFSRPPYSYKTDIVGLVYLPLASGYIVGSLVGGRWSDYIMNRKAAKTGGHVKPEDRMRENAWMSSVVYPCALIWFGWAAKYKLHPAMMLVPAFLFGVTSMMIFGMGVTMLTEFIPKKPSVGVASNNFVRNSFAFVAAMIAEPLIDAIGYGWLFTGVGIICLATSISVVVSMYHFAPRWRERIAAGWLK